MNVVPVKVNSSRYLVVAISCKDGRTEYDLAVWKATENPVCYRTYQSALEGAKRLKDPRECNNISWELHQADSWDWSLEKYKKAVARL